MRGAQRIVKYFAVALAFFIMAGIVSAIMFAASTIGFIVGGEVGSSRENHAIESVWDGKDEEDINKLEINISAVDLKIEVADHWGVETNNDDIKAYTRGGMLFVEEKSHDWWGFNRDNYEVKVRIPSDYVFDEAKLDLGAGRVEIEELMSRTLSLNVGAGRTEIGKLVVTDKSNIAGGAGSLEIKDGSLNRLKFDMGVGKATLKAKLIGDCDLEAGVGKLEVEMLGSIDDYRVEVDKGLGSIHMNGQELGDDAVYGSGSNHVKVDGGVGSIELRTTER